MLSIVDMFPLCLGGCQWSLGNIIGGAYWSAVVLGGRAEVLPRGPLVQV